jgi:hypothetical protein
MKTKITINCSACGQPYAAEIRTMIDTTLDPEGKTLLLTGRLNSAICPHCNSTNVIAMPLLYHDPIKEVLITYVPMELNLNKDQQEKAVGDLLNQLPKDNFKGYMFNPRRALTLQSLAEQVLESDGVTPEMMAEQKERVRIAQELVDATPNQLPTLVQKYDEEIDMRFFQTLTMMAQRSMESGQSDIANQIIITQNQIAELSTYGQKLLQEQEERQEILEQVAQDIQQLGDKPTQTDFLQLAIQYVEDYDALQALVGLVRPAFDYEFFQQLAEKIGQAPTSSRDSLNTLRENLLELTTAFDQQSALAAQNAASFIQTLVKHQEPEQLLLQNIHLLDDTFMAVLNANIHQADRRNDTQTSTRLKQLYELVISILQDNMQPELRFVNELLAAENEEEASAMISEGAGQFGYMLIEVMDAVEEILAGQGNHPLANRLKALRNETEQALSH